MYLLLEMPLTESEKFNVVPFKRGWRVMSSEGTFFSDKPMSKRKAQAQQRALYAAKREQLEGDGLFDPFVNLASRTVAAVKKGVDVVKQRVTAVSRGIRNDYPPASRQTIAEYGDGLIENIYVRREPIQSFINKALDFITRGRWTEVKRELNYDKMFHLGLVATVSLPDGRMVDILMEKNEVISITPNFRITSDTARMSVEVPNDYNTTLRDFLGNAQRLGGPEFFKYDAFNNNCQMFVMTLLDANGLGSNPFIRSFVLQDAGSLLKRLPAYTSPFARTVTNIAGLASVAMYGEGKDVVMSPHDYFTEHQKLVALLNDTSGRLGAEAKEQASEAKRMKKKLTGKGKYKDQINAIATRYAHIPNIQEAAERAEEAVEAIQNERDSAKIRVGLNTVASALLGAVSGGPAAIPTLSFLFADVGLLMDVDKAKQRVVRGLEVMAEMAQRELSTRQSRVGDFMPPPSSSSNTSSSNVASSSSNTSSSNVASSSSNTSSSNTAPETEEARGFQPSYELTDLGLAPKKSRKGNGRKIEGRALKMYGGVRLIGHMVGKSNGVMRGSGLSAPAQLRLALALNENPDAEGLELIEILANLRLDAADREIARQIIVEVLDLPEDTKYGPAARSFMDLEGDELYERMWDVFELMQDDAGVDDPDEEDEAGPLTSSSNAPSSSNAAADPAGPDPLDPDLDAEERFQMQPAWLRRVSGGQISEGFKRHMEKRRAYANLSPADKAKADVAIAADRERIMTDVAARKAKFEERDAWNAEQRRKRDSPMGQFMSGLVKAGDFAADALSFVPGVGRVVSEAYKAFAPPGSAYAGSGRKKRVFTKKLPKLSGGAACGGAACMCGCGKVRTKFAEQLKKAGLDPKVYLDTAKAAAKKAGYDPRALEFSDNDTHKLMIHDNFGKAHRFGRVGYGDFHIWSKVDPPKAPKKRDTFRKSHEAIKGDWKKDKFSPNNLAINILW
jgi:hypothetical protein